MLRSLLPQGVSLSAQCSGIIPGDAVESITLIANELVTNAAKYAFAGRESGKIELGFRQEGAGWRLWVSDDGPGLPADHVSGSGKTFGKLLLTTLAARLNAEVRTATEGGARVEVLSGLTS
jgi:two-component sensor histidine kinase